MTTSSDAFTRRDSFRVLGAAAVAAATAPTVALAAEQAEPPKLKGRIKQCCTRGMFRKMPIDEACRTAKALGLHGLDLIGKNEWPALKEHGLVASMVHSAGSIKDGLNNKDKHPEFLKQFREGIAAAAEFGWKRVITMAGDRKGLTDAEGMANCVPVLKEAVKIAADHDVTICMELLNSKVNHPGYMCDKTAWGVELCKRVDSPRFKLLYDIYHMQIMEGDVIRTITDNIQHIGHFHTAGNPGRKDLDEEQELFYPAIMRAIAKLTEEGKYNGYVAHEFGAKKGLDSIRQAIQLCDV
ncbi:MAG: Hydroxypyruvate isomerase [Planctomycetes bacterium ADurb.Bin126]|nr:MAG: Hydroxypyruvate isomerase [Planctomycetes bacterium ADurb.Bin126]HOD80753.1 TIM barrel protein [Phycisphaerae bacterium]HQL71747.1 TIM barrel protein [Phycisphaerae bacterium]